MKNKTILIAAVCILAGTGFVVADYFALFGTSEKSEFVLQEIKYRPIDENTNSPIIGARIRCFQKGRKNDVCFQKDSGKLGVVSIMVPRTRISSNSLLFEQAHHFLSNGDSKMHVMLMHLDYSNQVDGYDVNDLFNHLDKIYRIKMKPHEFDKADSEQG